MTLADVFDGVMITFAMYTLNVFNPGRLLQVSAATQSYSMTEVKSW